jgi:flagellin-specific chaperone FliS
MLRHLLQANIHNDAAKIREVISLLETLNEGWRVIAD